MKFKAGDHAYLGGILVVIESGYSLTYEKRTEYNVRQLKDSMIIWGVPESKLRPIKKETMKNYQFNLTPAHIYGTEWEKRFNEIIFPKWEIVDFRPPIEGDSLVSMGPDLKVYMYTDYSGSEIILCSPRFIVRPLEPITDADRLTHILALLRGWNEWPNTEEGVVQRLDDQIREERKRRKK